jgi:hypothetical protein
MLDISSNFSKAFLEDTAVFPMVIRLELVQVRVMGIENGELTKSVKLPYYALTHAQHGDTNVYLGHTHNFMKVRSMFQDWCKAGLNGRRTHQFVTELAGHAHHNYRAGYNTGTTVYSEAELALREAALLGLGVTRLVDEEEKLADKYDWDESIYPRRVCIDGEVRNAEELLNILRTFADPTGELIKADGSLAANAAHNIQEDQNE